MSKSIPEKLRKQARVLNDAADYIEKLEEVLALAGKMNRALTKDLMECAERERDRGPRSPDR